MLESQSSGDDVLDHQPRAAERTIGQRCGGSQRNRIGLGFGHDDALILQIRLTGGGLQFGFRHRAGVALELELVDLSPRIRDCRIGIRPGEADFERRK